jgi:NitT/TauT family transport system substrate-binding protein
MRCIAAVAAGLMLALGIGPAVAQVPEIRLARQYSMGYLQFNVMDHEKLIQKHAALLGIPEVKVSWIQFNGPSTMNDALISDSIDIVAGSPSGMLTIWGRTRGTAQEVRAISALVSLPFKLNTNDPEIRGVDDLGRCGKIAVPSIKVSSPAMTLQMAAAQAYGAKEYARFDPLTVSMSPPDATISMLTKQGGVNCVFGLPPFLQQQLLNPGIHSVLNSFDVAGGPNTYTTAYTSARFRNRAPVLYRALYAALAEATDRVNADPRQASQYWIEDGGSKLALDFVAAAATEPQVRWTMVPERTMVWADFMVSVGTLKQQPKSWKDYFWPEAHGLDGS